MTPVDVGVFALIAAGGVASLVGYSVYQIATPPAFDDSHVKFVDHFQLLGALAFLVPLLMATILLGMVGALLLRGHRAVATTSLAAVGPKWAERAKRLSVGGWIPGLVVICAVGLGDQLRGSPTTPSSVFLGSAGVVIFVVIWMSIRRNLRAPWHPSLRQAVLVTGVVAAFVSVNTITRVQDEHSFQTLYPLNPSLISNGFHTLTAQPVRALESVFVSCANTSDCVLTGEGTGYSRGTFDIAPLLGTTTDGGATWNLVEAGSQMSSLNLPNCGPTSCSVILYGNPNQMLTIAFGGTPASRLSEAAVPTAPLPQTAPICIASHCVAFAQTRSDTNIALSTNTALFSTNDGKAWSSAPLPPTPPIGGRQPLLADIRGPWCSSALECHGILTAESRLCTPDPGTPFCSQLTLLQTVDGGKTWTAQTTPLNQPTIEVGSVQCTTAGDCTGIGLAGGFYRSSDWGARWQGPERLPEGADWVNCWNATGCTATNGPNEVVTTLNGGRTWHEQTVDGPAGDQPFPVWCDPTGACVGVEQNPRGMTPTIITRATPTATWATQQLPLPLPPLKQVQHT